MVRDFLPMTRPIRWAAPWHLEVLDQTRLPFATDWRPVRSAADGRESIVTMQVRGAPLIGAVGAFALAFAARADASDAAIATAADQLISARPTAVNLAWAVRRVVAALRPLPAAARADAAWAEAVRIAEADAAGNAAIGAHGAAVLRTRLVPGRPLQLLTHCNAGWLATAGHGTALAPIYALHAEGVPVHVWVDETRPRNQGAALTAWELREAGVPHTVIADNAGGVLLMRGAVDAVIVGADRVAANGDVANKVGTYLKALAARAHNLPCYVACPTSTLDPATASGADIVIEERDPHEVTHVTGRRAEGDLATVCVVPEGTRAANPAFDITPAALVTGLITEHGLVDASPDGVRSALAARSA